MSNHSALVQAAVVVKFSILLNIFKYYLEHSDRVSNQNRVVIIFLLVMSTPMGTSHINLPSTQRSKRSHFCFCCSSLHGRTRLTFDQTFKNATGDILYNHNCLYEIYQKADPKITTSVTVPILWDKQLKTIVNNESSQIIRIFNTAFNTISENYI